MEKTTDAEIIVLDLETTKLTPEDALNCLTCDVDVRLPTPNVQACNNLDEYLTKSTTKSYSSTPSKKSSKRPKGFLPTFSREPFATPLVRNFDKILKKPKEDGIQAESNTGLIPNIKRFKPDVFSRAQSLEKASGPLHLLKEHIDQTVKVMIRRRRKVPYISRVIEYKGTLVLFDKHMNLYMKDVIESFKYSIGDKILKRARHRDNIFVRGDNIIMIL